MKRSWQHNLRYIMFYLEFLFCWIFHHHTWLIFVEVLWDQDFFFWRGGAQGLLLVSLAEYTLYWGLNMGLLHRMQVLCPLCCHWRAGLASCSTCGPWGAQQSMCSTLSAPRLLLWYIKFLYFWVILKVTYYSCKSAGIMDHFGSYGWNNLYWESNKKWCFWLLTTSWGRKKYISLDSYMVEIFAYSLLLFLSR